MPSGLTIVIYADEGHNFLEYSKKQSEESKTPNEESMASRRQLEYDSYYQPLPSAGLPSNGPLYDLGTFLRFAIKCTDCLEFIHRNNVVHGEIRLSAFQWTGDDGARVKMWNFGSRTKS